MRIHSFEQTGGWEEQPIYLPYEDGMRNRERRALRGPSVKQRRNTAREEQARSGQRIRIARRVLNQLDFKKELEVWIPFVQDGVASRRSLGNLAITLFDTNQQPLRFAEECTEEELKDRFEVRYPALFQNTPPIEVVGTDRFGDKSMPFIGLILAPGFAYSERREVRGIAAPELLLDDSHQNPHKPHVSLGQAFTREAAGNIQNKLDLILPGYVQFAPADITVEHTL